MPEKDTGPTLIDIREDSLLELSPEVLETLLRDHTTGKNIFWATHDYEALGSEYDYHSEILPNLITGEHGMVIRPRVLKSKENQTDRSKDMAEVFTPSWICNAQNNLVENALPNDMMWQDYVCLTCLEITCGEAPYLVSRYDATTGEPIPVEKRIGLLDRKLHMVSENTETQDDWLKWAEIAYQNIYGYEWQGDNLLLAREALLWTFIEYYQAKFGRAPLLGDIVHIADIISWNLWQMDGLRCVVPDSCHEVEKVIRIEATFFESAREERKKYPCPGCDKDDITNHNGKYCIIFDWEAKKEIKYIDLIQQQHENK